MATKGIVIQLNREQRVFLLKALKDGYIDLGALHSVGIRPASRFENRFENMTDEELANETVRIIASIRSAEPFCYEDETITKRVCKECFNMGSCWLSWKARDDRELHDRIRGIMEQKT